MRASPRITLCLLGCAALPACEPPEPPAETTQLLIEVSAEVPLDELVLRASSAGGPLGTIREDVAGRDLAREPFTVLLEPAPPAPGQAEGSGEFLLHGQGLAGGQARAGASAFFAFEEGRRVEKKLRLRTSFIDVDGDGFPLCDGERLCDCNDANAAIHVYAAEVCGDELDNDCSGQPADESCETCSAGDAPLPCTELVGGEAALAGIGACSFGGLECVGGRRETECDSGAPTPDRRDLPGNFIDDDCDGAVDEGSPCAAGSSRLCHRGFVDDPSHPDPAQRSAASELAQGECADAAGQARGRQYCVGGVWAEVCTGDVLPVRYVGAATRAGFYEPWCDGRDEDCDGVVDEERAFDQDDDGYTHCGTRAAGGLDEALLDCDDQNPDVHPNADEICDNGVDDDCRCDHGQSLGEPSRTLDGQPACASGEEHLRCAEWPRSDPTQPGTCDDGSGPLYYYGYVSSGSGERACHACAATFGAQCVYTEDGSGNVVAGHCSTREEACQSCAVRGAVVEARPLCSEEVTGSCAGQTAPAWQPLAGDPYEDCGVVSCAGYFSGRGGPSNAQCFALADAPAAAVSCAGLGSCDEVAPPCCDGSTPELCCQPAAAVCTSGRGPQATPLPMALCQKVVGGCAYPSTAPVLAAQALGEDLFGECNDSFVCNSAAGGGPFYDGIRGTPAQCFFKDDVSGTACNGAGACQSQAQACAAVPSGTRPAPKPACKVPSGGCSGTTAPLFEQAVPLRTDPYNECPAGLGCCANGCCADLGDACAGPDDCRSGLTCIDGVCCASSCAGACYACAESLTGQPDGQCAPMAVVAQDTAPGTVCGGTTGGCAGGSCTCEAGTGACKTQSGAPCASNLECAGGQCECADAACSQRRCSAADCDCRYNAAGDASCDGPLNDGVDDGDNSCAAQSCNGAGTCNLAPSSVCTSHEACESNHCECQSSSCASRSCSAVACVCRYNGNGDGSCEGALGGGLEDPQDCTGASSCYGGVCLADLGQPCASDAGCGSGECECASVDCTSRVCASADCDCGHDAGGGCGATLANGLDDPEDCVAPGSSCYDGVCTLDQGQGCSGDADCGSGQCECTSPDCSFRQCSAIACPCGFDADGNGVCDGNLTSGVDDPEDCQGPGISCYAGACKKDVAELCATDVECGSLHCECTSAACLERRCSPGACVCRFDVGADGFCDGDLSSGLDDPEDCEASGTSCFGGACKKDNGQSCDADAECGAANCECTSSSCSSRACDAVACLCRYDAIANGSCDASLSDGVDDPEDCATAGFSCYGGSCRRDVGQSCTADAQCGSSSCECVDATCSSRRCAVSACLCGFDAAPASGGCDGSLGEGVDDPEDCAGATSSCFGGVCKGDNGQGCGADAECGSGNCECADAGCASRRCAPLACLCTYDAGADGTCETELDAGTVDPEDCAALGFACYAGACKKEAGQSCGGDSECGSGNCECADPACATRLCGGAACLCGYDAGGDGACDGALNGGTKDPEDCVTSGMSCYAGVCQRDNAQSCTTDAECGSGNCECTGATCATRLCSAVTCTCRFDTTGNGSCDGMLNPGIDDPEDCVASDSSCYGGSCLRDLNQACSSDAQCGSGHCECQDSLCSSRRCSVVACVCGFNASGTTADCDGALTDTTDDPEDCAAAGQSCYAGICKRDNTEPCSADGECGSGNCECTEATCAARRCAAATCLCRFDAGADGSCDGVLAAGYDDPEDCAALGSSCYGGACKKDDAESCVADDECGSGNCECTSPDCLARQCNAIACACGYDTLANGSCDANLTPGTDDPEDCFGTSSCYGAACLLDLNLGCSADAQCGSGNCECTDASCSTRRCSQLPCPCGYNSDGATASCDGTLTPGLDDPEDCIAAGSSCYGGSCKKDNGQSCGADAECGNANCECTGATCSARQCSATACLCRYDSGANGSCDGDLTTGQDDPEDCTALGFSCWAGACKRDNGQSCLADSECGSQNCECIDAACAERRCSAAACPCRYDGDSSGSCDGNLTTGVDDPEDCTALGSSCYAGACGKDNGVVCAANAECGNGQCECGNAACSTKVCSSGDCATCRFTATGGEGCAGFVDPYIDDADQSCLANQSCNGAGSCESDNNVACSVPGECISNICECASSASCGTRKCSAVSCPCGYNTDGNGTCDGTFANASDPDGDCGNYLCQSGACDTSCEANDDAQCKTSAHCDLVAGAANDVCAADHANGQACERDADCTSGQCECQNAGCTAKVCSSADCPTCRFTANGTDGCQGFVAMYVDDADGCLVNQSCNGAGTCLSDNDIGCSFDGDCASGICECASAASCGTRECSPVSCPCGYNSNGDAVCEGPFGALQDPDNDCGTYFCAGGSFACDTTCEVDDDTQCKLAAHCDVGAGNDVCSADHANGQACTLDRDCASGNCECQNAACSARVCRATACPCGYDSAGSCAALNAGVEDPEDCTGASSCYGGFCRLDNGQGCASDSACGSNQCECQNNTCSAKVCSSVDCGQCRYSANGVDACPSLMAAGYDDADNSCGVGSACTSSGGCAWDNGTTGCFGNGNCASGICECQNANCSNTVCSAVVCGACRYNANGDGVCDNNFTNGTDPLWECGGHWCESGACDANCSAGAAVGCKGGYSCISGTCF